MALRVVPELRYTVLRSLGKRFDDSAFRGRFWGAKCTVASSPYRWPPTGLDTVAASFFFAGEESDREAPPASHGSQTQRRRAGLVTVLRDQRRVSLYTAGYTQWFAA